MNKTELFHRVNVLRAHELLALKAADKCTYVGGICIGGGGIMLAQGHRIGIVGLSLGGAAAVSYIDNRQLARSYADQAVTLEAAQAVADQLGIPEIETPENTQIQ